MKILKSISNLIPFTEYTQTVFLHLILFLVLSRYLSTTATLLGIAWSVIVWISFDISFHRMWSHGALKCTKTMEWIFSFINVFAGMKSAIDFCGPHIWHHKYSDTKKDTYWPTGVPIWKILTQHKSIYKNVNKTEMLKGCRHLFKNKAIKFFHNYYYAVFLLIHLVLAVYDPLLIIPIVSMPVLLAYMINIPGGVLLQHTWGERITKDKSTNNRFLSFISFGLLCQHSNHHKHPSSHTFNTDKDSFDLIEFAIEKLMRYNLVWIPSK